MELEKEQNMIEHQDEIFSRPARTWFQTTKEKHKSKGTQRLNFGTSAFMFSQTLVNNRIQRKYETPGRSIHVFLLTHIVYYSQLGIKCRA